VKYSYKDNRMSLEGVDYKGIDKLAKELGLKLREEHGNFENQRKVSIPFSRTDFLRLILPGIIEDVRKSYSNGL